MRIGELAEDLRTSTKTLRFYERSGLLPPPARLGNGYRAYDERAVARARLVVGLRRIGLSVEEVRELLAGEAATQRRRLLGVLDRHLQEVGLQISILQGQHDDLAARYRALLETPRDQAGECVCAAIHLPCTCREDDESASGKP
jgi:DNA-binding transcriptional MerR regulator